MSPKIKINSVFAPVFLLAVFLIIFAKFLNGSAVLMSTDAMVSSANESVASVIHLLPPAWVDGALLGGPGGSGTQVASLLKGLLPGIIWNNLVYGLACLAGSLIFLKGFSRYLNRWAVLCGALTAFWLGNNFTLIYPGHGFKPYVVLFFVCALLSAGATTWRGGIMWGSFVGLMFAQQPDIALFFTLFAGAHFVFRIWYREGFKWTRWTPVLVPAAIVAFLFAAGPLLGGYKTNVKDSAQAQAQNPIEKWDYMTQWSWPPEESIAFIAPGYTGWRTGEPDGPYYGRMGRSAEWDRSHQGFMNFQLDSLYIGFIPIAFALFALFASRRSSHRAEIIFWSSATVLALLLAFGKNFPLYSLFYQLPVVNNIRNPVKFIQIFQVGLGILTAYGIHLLLFEKPSISLSNTKIKPIPDRVCRCFFWTATGAAGILLVWALNLSFNPAESINSFAAQGWPGNAAATIVNNQTRALWHAFFMATFAAAVFAIFIFDRFIKVRSKGLWIAAALALAIATDALLLSKHYMQKMPRSYIQANDLTRFLKDNLGTQRVALLTQQDVYNIWVTYLLPYNHIPTFNFAQMSRMPADYKNFLTATSKDPFRMWRLSSVKFLLGPTSFEKQLPPGAVKKVFTYNLVATQENEFQVVSTPKGNHAVFELIDSIPRYVLVAKLPHLTDNQALARISDSRQPLLGGQGATGTVELIDYRSGKATLKTFAEMPTVLRIAERWDADWKAIVDGRDTEVKRIDYLCQGVELPSGAHEVILTYSPDKLFFYLQIAGFILMFAVMISFHFRKEITTPIGIKTGAGAA